MDNKEQLEEALKDLKNKQGSLRITGRSSRMLNDYIEDFFQKPMGTKIEIFDHYFGYNAYENGFDVARDKMASVRNARIMMCQNIKRRLNTEYPNVNYELTSDFFLIRKSKTYHEILKDQIDELESKLNKYDNIK